jgi:hypothetical protein
VLLSLHHPWAGGRGYSECQPLLELEKSQFHLGQRAWELESGGVFYNMVKEHWVTSAQYDALSRVGDVTQVEHLPSKYEVLSSNPCAAKKKKKKKERKKQMTFIFFINLLFVGLFVLTVLGFDLGLMLAREVLYFLSHSTSPFLGVCVCFVFWR